MAASRLALVCVGLGVTLAGCGASAAESGPRDPSWPATPPTQTVTCGAPLGSCPHSSSLRVRWPQGARVPGDAQISVGERSVDAAEIELGVCAAAGTYPVRVSGAVQEDETNVSQRGASFSAEVLAGVETRVALSRAPTPGALTAQVELVPLDVGATVAALADVTFPSIASDATPEERRVFGPVLGAAFDAWRARLTRVRALAETQHDAVLRAAALDHEGRAEAIAATIAEERPSADRLAAIQRAMRTEAEEAAAMIAIEHACPLYAHRDPGPTLAPVAIEARPYGASGVVVSRMRVAIDDVEVLDVGAVDGDELIDRTSVEGVVPPGEHVMMAEATFVPRAMGVVGAYVQPRRVLERQRVVIAESGTRVWVRARRTGPPTAPLEDALVVEISAQ